MQDDYNRFIEHSIRQAQCQYEDIFTEDVMSEQMETDQCGNALTMQTKKCGSDKMYRPENELPVMVFIEMQQFGKMYNEAEGLQRGTLFPALDKPFMGGGYRC